MNLRDHGVEFLIVVAILVNLTFIAARYMEEDDQQPVQSVQSGVSDSPEPGPIPTGPAPTASPAPKQVSQEELMKMIRNDEILFRGRYGILEALEVVMKSGDMITTGPLIRPEWSDNPNNFIVDSDRFITGEFKLSEIKSFLKSEGFEFAPAPVPTPTP